MSLLTSCNVGNSHPASESAFRSNEVHYYDSEQQMDLFTQDKEPFEGLFNALYDSEYTFLSFNQRYDGEIRWTILNTDETEIAQFKDVDSDIISDDVLNAINSFFDKYHCRSVDWNGGVLTISFWNEWGNDGIIRTEEGPSEDVADFYNELAENWYYFALPTV